jgi:hypothetical protein
VLVVAGRSPAGDEPTTISTAVRGWANSRGQVTYSRCCGACAWVELPMQLSMGGHDAGPEARPLATPPNGDTCPDSPETHVPTHDKAEGEGFEPSMDLNGP